jgi:D-3-phosphoglycerate dehydrogenase
MLALGKRVVEADRHLRRTPDLKRHRFVGHNTQGRTLGVIGFGHVGQGLARLCAQALQMRVLVHSSHADAAALAAVGAERATLDNLLQHSDYVAVCCALTEATRGLLGAAEFARMKRGAIFITTARGGIHDRPPCCRR